MVIDNKAHFQSESLTSLHLGHAIDLMHKSNNLVKTKSNVYEKQLAKRCALSSILHCFCAFDSEINHLGVSMFQNPSAQIYIAKERRDFLLEKFVRSWNTKSTLEKLAVILQSAGEYKLSANIEAKLRELNILRNWITHGISSITTLTLELIDEEKNEYGSDQTFKVLKEEKGVDWKTKFPNTKFNSPEELNSQDAQTALKIVIDILKIISEIKSQPISITTCEYEQNFHLLWKESFNNLEFLKLN